jgi:diguanylate cyclase (GGDEF)-like protein
MWNPMNIDEAKAAPIDTTTRPDFDTETAGIPTWGKAAWRRAKRWLAPALERGASFEEMVENFTLAVESAVQRSEIELMLIQIAERWLPNTQVTASRHTSPASADGVSAENGRYRHRWVFHPGQSALEVPIRGRSGIVGHLAVSSREAEHCQISPSTIQRLSALCTMAGCTIERLGGASEWQNDDESGDPCESRFGRSGPRGELSSSSHLATAPSVHDATFLAAVLPFAIGQARRHRETLTILCVSVDRLAAIADLLGRSAADLLVRNVADAVASLLRASDIVVRLDDGRIVAVLPRASCENGMLVAEKIRADVAEKNSEAALMPGVTVSIGVATFPTTASSMNELLEAADVALEQARTQGRDQTVMAQARIVAADTHALPHRRQGVADKIASTLI